jgi:hypothetical protein
MTGLYWHDDTQTLHSHAAVGNRPDFHPHPEWLLIDRYHPRPRTLHLTSPGFHELPVG